TPVSNSTKLIASIMSLLIPQEWRQSGHSRIVGRGQNRSQAVAANGRNDCFLFWCDFPHYRSRPQRRRPSRYFFSARSLRRNGAPSVVAAAPARQRLSGTVPSMTRVTIVVFGSGPK